MNEKTYSIRDTVEDEHGGRKIIREVSLAEILEEINRDRSADWTDYDETDWKEGLSEFTYWELIV